MARRGAEEDWEDDEFDRDDASDDDSTVACPYCQRAIHEDAVRCPYCENYISAEDSPAARKSWFIILGAIAAGIVIYLWIMH